MIYHWDEPTGFEEEKRIGFHCYTHRTAKCFDANGLQWKNVLWCDTEAGILERVIKDGDGHYKMDAATGDVVTEVVKTAAPLRVEFDR